MALQTLNPAADVQDVLAALAQARERTLALVAHLSDAQLENAYSPIMSPLVWDLAHIAAYEDLWLAQRLCGLELLRPDLAELYDAFETPRALRSEIEILGHADARAYMDEVRERVAQALSGHGVGDGVVCEMVVRHELQHTETMRQAMAIACLLPDGEPPLNAMTGRNGWVEIPRGSFLMGAGQEGFAYDNERPRHAVALEAFAIARRPVSNGAWLEFFADGGYDERRWWSQQGWEWRTDNDATPHPAIAAGDPRAAACHVCFFEAEAFARAHGARLPAEAEWERAARGVGGDAGSQGRADAAVGPDGAAGALEATGQVWEWTRSAFGGYPGFRAHPYREYSEVFFGDGYRVLRGGSWATSPRVATVTFRNWDLPQRRQIFAGVRLARDLT
ncbi:MAG TPA: SUMF1/EgtB/PvdO family nonheme iron enzyme [Solirubrobacteraceae bacterium]|jgi:iron(II)-dependent oxidoreductase|nr:SUMF1/EgtB/PvdO family nonheme iron enzyme [Solirubrobacteraceae bacterium]